MSKDHEIYDDQEQYEELGYGDWRRYYDPFALINIIKNSDTTEAMHIPVDLDEI